MFKFEQFLEADLDERRRLISDQAALETFPEGLASQLQMPFRASKVINRFLGQFIEDQIQSDQNNPTGSVLLPDNFAGRVDEIFEAYRPGAMARIEKMRPTREELIASPKNLYELAGSVQLAFANKVSRTISTTMGSLWEQIANISPYVVNPETELGIKIPGVDIILKNVETSVIEHAQLKTQKNTLTGGQSGRVDAELSIHDHPIFCACFSTNPQQNWSLCPKSSFAQYPRPRPKHI